MDAAPAAVAAYDETAVVPAYDAVEEVRPQGLLGEVAGQSGDLRQHGHSVRSGRLGRPERSGTVSVAYRALAEAEQLPELAPLVDALHRLPAKTPARTGAS
ncbi:hypothetical protein [Micromonospora sp. SL4-19]|uniref:hypothetical protein n=1 Tax=Micromonospora sp. SL4-19 TaxID=3399129 RepID=UPI003A4E128C